MRLAGCIGDGCCNIIFWSFLHNCLPPFKKNTVFLKTFILKKTVLFHRVTTSLRSHFTVKTSVSDLHPSAATPTL